MTAPDVASLLSGETVNEQDRQAGVQAAIEKFVKL